MTGLKKITDIHTYIHTYIRTDIATTRPNGENIIQTDLNYPQAYLLNPLFSNKQTSLLLNLQRQFDNEFKANIFISLCMFCKIYLDTQDHALPFNTIKTQMNKELLSPLNSVKYNDMYSDVKSQRKITRMFQSFIHMREQLRAPSLDPAYPGQSTRLSGSNIIATWKNMMMI